ncbi:MAG: protein kinase [Thiothrix sp.]
MSDIFLSYASNDRERVRQLANVLGAQGWSVFWDRTIPTGTRWHEVLGDELDASSCVIVVWTETSVRSQWVYEEAEEGKRRRALFPVKLDHVLPPLGFRMFQVANLTGWQGEMDSPALTRLLEDIKAHFTLLRQQEEIRLAEEEAARKAEEERKRAAAEAARKAEEERKRAEAEAARKAEAERKRAEAETARKAEAERKRAEAETARKAEAERKRAEEAAQTPEARLKQANYDILGKLGEGGMATVFLAQHTLLEREVALKVMSPRIATTEAFRQSFIREARIVAQLEHPNIVRIYDGGADGNLFYMAMELLPGGTLKEQLESGPLLPEHALNIVRQIASALSYAHSKGYIHRDIKPANILFRSNGDAALADFGIAKLQGIVSDMTQLGLITGTPRYMSPEQAAGTKLDHRTDLYSLGIVFHEMLTGQLPFNGSSPMAIAYQHLNAPMPRLPNELAGFQPTIDKLVAKQPHDRFDSANALLQALAGLDLSVTEIRPINELPSPETHATTVNPAILPPTRPEHTSERLPPSPMATASAPPMPRRKARIWLAGITAVAGLGIGGGYYTINMQKVALEANQRAEQVSNHLELARLRGEKQRLFDHSTWSEGCKNLLEDMDGPYEAADSSEWHYHQVQTLDPANAIASWELEKLENRKKIEFSNCDNYKRPEQEVDEINDMFKK